ncbi:MAG: N-methyl-L-tryptophan oxidase [Planctomycetia bacterium]|nr:N-methyl-L-tryptophan oxidase [Planctomycetia bacterium]
MNADTIVIGLGAMGLSAAWQLSRRGQRVLGLEQFGLAHDRGSSHGQTRIIRQAYYEHPDYVPLARRAYEGWFDLEQSDGRRFVTICPCLSLGPVSGELILGVRRAAREHSLPVEELNASDVRRRFPAFEVGDDMVGILEHTAGIVAVEDSLLAMAADARRFGVELRENETVVAWRLDGSGVSVETTSGTYRAERLVITAGPWARRFLDEPLTVMRQVVFWFAGTKRQQFRRDVFPVFIADTPGGYYYGIPALDTRGVKVAQHYGADELPSPDAINRQVGPADEAAVRAFLQRYLPSADDRVEGLSVCLYTLTPDRHFLIDQLEERVVFAAGFSGHGFKFAPVVGEILADLSMWGKTSLPAALFRRRAFTPV